MKRTSKIRRRQSSYLETDNPNMKKVKFKTVSAKNFRDKDGYYQFPFEALDKTIGGSNLGRIEWHLELVPIKKRGRFYIEKLFLWASQTRDPRYTKKVFEIPCWSEALTADSLRERGSYMHYVWRVMICELHKNVLFSAYPANEHSVLKINVDSSISIDADFI